MNILKIILLLTLTCSAMASDEGVVVSVLDQKQSGEVEEVSTNFSQEQLESSMINATGEISELINGAMKASQRPLASFELAEIEVSFAFGVSGGFFLVSGGVEGGVVLHYTKVEEE